MRGPAIFLAQFIGAEAPYNSLKNIAKWASGLGFKAVQLPTLDPRFFDLALAAQSPTYCDEVKGVLAQFGLQVSELSTHIQGQMIAVHPAYASQMDGFAPAHLHKKPQEQQAWAQAQLICAAQASRNLGLSSHASFSGSLLWPMFYPWPARPAGLVDEAFAELAKRWLPILDAFDEAGVNLCYELHPGEDLHDGASFERFLDHVGQHPRANILYDPSHLLLQHIDLYGFIDCYHQRIKAFHVKDAEFQMSAKTGVYGGYLDWTDRAGRFRSLGDGQIDFKRVFSKLIEHDYDGWAVMEWECCLKNSEDGAREGAAFIAEHIFRKTERAFDDFANVQIDGELQRQRNRDLLGI